MKIYNTAGMLVETLAEREFTAGRHSLNWNAETVSSGLYLYKISGAKSSVTGKMMYLR